MIYRITIPTEEFELLVLGAKTYVIVENDHDYKVGDWLLLLHPDSDRTGASILRYVSYAEKVMDDRYCIMALKKSPPTTTTEESI